MNPQCQPFNRTILYGEGLFETILWKGRTRRLFRHYERMKNSADFFKIPCPTFREFVDLIEKETKGERDLYVKFCLFSWGDQRFYSLPSEYRTMVIVRPYRKVQSLKLSVSPFKRNSKDPLIYHKTMNYLFNILVKRKAITEGFDDAVILNERDEVTECSSSNLILLKDEMLFTPSQRSGLLRGTTLSLLMERFEIREIEMGIEELMEADAIFATNSISGAVPVTRFMDLDIPVRRDILEDLNRAIDEEDREE